MDMTIIKAEPSLCQRNKYITCFKHCLYIAIADSEFAGMIQGVTKCQLKNLCCLLIEQNKFFICKGIFKSALILKLNHSHPSHIVFKLLLLLKCVTNIIIAVEYVAFILVNDL